MTEKDPKLPEATSRLEWLVAAMGALLILGTIGYMIAHGLRHPEAPPDVTVTQTSGAVLSDGFLVEFSALNEGNATAANVTVSGALIQDGEVVEESETTLDYLPEQAHRTGGLFFTNDPASYEVQLRAEGYIAP
ncbi:MAG: hypothetical protein FJX25_09340 [Alphaproteobacteria bacterium]|nr:hypothetical protein [Alphaproteobacteria bacterium]